MTTTKTTPTATFARDIEGGWGVRVPATDATVGATVTITKRDGSTKTVQLTEVWPEDTDGAGRIWARFTEVTKPTRRTPLTTVPDGVNPFEFAAEMAARHAARPTAARPTYRTTSHGTRGRCDECGETRSGLTAATDSSGIAGMVCRPCSRTASYELSFA